MKGQILALACCAGAILAALSGCAQTDRESESFEGKTVVTLGYLPITHALALFQLKETLAAEDSPIAVKLQKFGNWSDLTDALNAGRIDGASVLIQLAMSAKSKGVDLKVVALGHKDGNVVVASNKIEKVEDLKGKKIAIPSTQSSHFILVQEALKRGNLTPSDVKIVQLAPTEMPFSLASGAVDAYCVAEPFGAQTAARGLGRVLFDSKELWDDSICCGLVLNQRAIDALGTERVDALAEKYLASGESLDLERSRDLAKRYLGQSPEVLETSLKWIRFGDLSIDPEAYRDLSDRVRDYGINAEPPSYEDFVYVVER